MPQQSPHCSDDFEAIGAGFFSETSSESSDADTSSDEKLKLIHLALNDTGLEMTMEEDLSQELGCRLWTGALILCAKLRSAQRIGSRTDPLFLQNKTVLEIGAGLGACGFTAAANGAALVTIGECGPRSLARLVQSAENYESVSPASNVTICRHLWEEDMEYLASRDEGRPMDKIHHWSKYEQSAQVPSLDFQAKFDVIIGSDLLYFSSQEQALLATLRLHLAPSRDSVVVLLQTMRTNNVSIFGRFIEEARKLFHVEVVDVDVTPEAFTGMEYHETHHRTGYKLVTLRHHQTAVETIRETPSSALQS